MKKINISALIAGSIIVISSTITTSAFYTDVPEDHIQYESIKTLYDLNLLPQYENNLFYPDENLKKADLYEFILVYANADLSTEIELPYLDTDNNANYATYIQTALDYEILHPHGLDPKLNPDGSISKYKTLSTMFETLGVGSTYFLTEDEFPFIDLKISSQQAKIASTAAKLEILETTNPTYFQATKRITRAEAADYLYKIHIHNSDGTLTVGFITPTQSEEIVNASEFENPSTFLDVWETLQTEYLYKDELDNKELEHNAINGLMEQINDIYTIFHEPEEADSFLDSLSSEYEGVGMSVEMINEQVVIVSPLKNSPAEEVGLLPNDIIIKVNDEDISGQSLETVVSKIKGISGTEVKLTILRNNDELNFIVTREAILVNTVEYEILESNNENIGYLEILYFGTLTYSDFVIATEELSKQNIDNFIIDLRNNPGGYMNPAISISDLFIEESKTIVSLVDADKEKTLYESTSYTPYSDSDIVVLLNEGTASASEILAGALQDHNKAELIGTVSFGKGTAQAVTEYTDGSIFKYTISKWLTPNDTNIDDTGITPDTIIENNNDTDLQLEEALKRF